MRRVLFTLLVFHGLMFRFASPSASASETKEAREKAALKACMTGRYQDGLEILADLYIETHEPTYIFNQARCLQQNHRWEDALDRFREYKRKAGKLKESDREETDQLMKECEDELAKSKASPPLPPPTLPVPQPSPHGAQVAPDPGPSDAPPDVRSKRGGGMRTAGFITGAAGLALVGVGVYCSVKSHGVADDEDALNRYRQIGIVSYAAGGVAIATGVALLIWGRAGVEEARDPAVALVPLIESRQASLMLQGHF